MPKKKTLEETRKAKREGKAATTQAGAFVKEEIEHMKTGKHPVKSRKQAVAIRLSKARKSGIKVPQRASNSRSTRSRRKSRSSAKT